MTSKKELQLAYSLAIVLLIVGVFCYAALSSTKPEPPNRIMFQCMAGKVLFDHKAHTSESGYGISCMDCHHNLEEGETKPETCGECHLPGSDEDGPKRGDAFHQQCKGCHENDGGPVECNACHVL